MTQRKVFLVVLFFIFVVSFVSRLNILSNSFVSDDFVLIVNNSFIQSTQNFFKVINPINLFKVLPIKCGARPITVATYILEYSVYGLNPLGYHLSNLLIHCFNVVLVFVFAYFLINRKKLLFACAAALFFSLHPIQSEVVSVIGFRANLLSVLFALLSLNCVSLLEFTAKKYYKILYVLVLVFAILSLLSKENSLILPILFILMYFIIYKKSINKKISIVSFVIISIIFLFFWIERFPVPLYYSIYPQIDTNLIPMANISLYLKIIITSLFYNVLHVIYPIDLASDYTLIFSNFKIFITLIALILIIYFSVYKNKSKVLLFAFLFSVITYLPISNLIPLVNTVADRYMYMTMIGVSFIFALLVLKIFDINKKIAYIFFVSLVILFAFCSYERGKIYSNSYLLYSDAIKKVPNNARVVYNMGVSYFANNEFDNAILQLKKSFEINPFYFTDRVWFITGLSYEKLGDKQNALKYYYKAFLINPSDKEIVDTFISQFNSKQEVKDFIVSHSTFIRENIIKAVEEHK